MPPYDSSSRGSTFNPAGARVPVLLTLLFWAAAVSLLFIGPSIVDDLIGVAASFALYVCLLLGYGLHLEAKEQRRRRAPRRSNLSYLRVSPVERPVYPAPSKSAGAAR